MRQLLVAVCVTMLVLILSPMGDLANAQIPDEYTNLQVLDQKIEKSEHVNIMRSMSGALRVRCVYCHVGEDGASLEGFDFASDEKPTKVIAREMMRMTNSINSTIGEIQSAHETKVKVECVTCHRGQERPRLIDDVINEAYVSGGLDSARALYLNLREEHYGSHTYDFSERRLLSYGENLAQAGNVEEGIEVMQLSVELHPESASGHARLAALYFQSGNNEKAREFIEKAVAMDPEDPQVKWINQRISNALGH